MQTSDANRNAMFTFETAKFVTYDLLELSGLISSSINVNQRCVSIQKVFERCKITTMFTSVDSLCYEQNRSAEGTEAYLCTMC